MKFLITLGFIAIAVLQVIVALKLLLAALSKIKDGKGHFEIYVLSYLTFIISFLEFCLLTEKFPGLLLLRLLLFSGASSLVYLILGAISGVTLKQTQQKIGALSMISGLQNVARGKITIYLGNLVFLSSIVGTLWAFWSYPIGDPNAVFMIAITLIFFPMLLGSVTIVFTSWPAVTSEFLDNDVRNSSLINGFSQALLTTAFLLFPFWLFHEGVPATFHPFFSSYWIPLSAPLMIFVIGVVIPFFVGIYQYRAQSKIMLKWEEDWLNKASSVDVIPLGTHREQAIEDLFEELSHELDKSVSAKNYVDQYYQALTPADVDPNIPMGQLNDDVLEILRKNHDNLDKWDIRFAYVKKLHDLQQQTLEWKMQNLKAFFDSHLRQVTDQLKNMNSRKNILSGVLTGVLTSLLTGLALWLIHNLPNLAPNAISVP